jgi:hypothetical protein
LIGKQKFPRKKKKKEKRKKTKTDSLQQDNFETGG